MKEQKKYEQKASVKVSKKFRDIPMKLKIDLGFKDLEALIQKMHDIILKHKLLEQMKNSKGGSTQHGRENNNNQ